MNKYLSILELNIKRSLWKVLIVAAAMFAAEFFWARSILTGGGTMRTAEGFIYNYPVGLDYLGKQFVICFIVAAFLVTIFQLWPLRTKSSGYRMDLLLISERRWLLLSAVYYTACIFLLWAITACAIYASYRVYTGLPQFQGGAQYLYVTIIQTDQLNMFVPLDNTSALLYMIITVLGTGMITAATAMRMMRGKSQAPIFLAAILISVMKLRAGAMDGFARVAAYMAAFASLIVFFDSMMSPPARDDAEEESNEK